MRNASLIGHARELLELVVASPLPADILYDRYIRERRYLGARDRRTLSDLYYTALRQLHTARAVRLPGHDDAAITPSEIQALLAIVLFRRGLFERDEIRDGLKLNDDEINVIISEIEGFQTSVETLPDVVRLASRLSFPNWLTNLIVKDHGAMAEPLMESLKQEANTTIRIDADRFDLESVAKELTAAGISTRPTRYAKNGLIVERRGRIIDLDLFQRGAFEIQDEGSQLLTEFLSPERGWDLFDACAGGGGKSLHIASMLNAQGKGASGTGRILAHDIDIRRLSGLPKRIERHRFRTIEIVTPPTFILNQHSYQGSFDAVLLDAPCSGTGTLRRNPGILFRLDRGELERLMTLQSDILDLYSSLVKPGGILLYATCSILSDENHEQVRRFLNRHDGWMIDREGTQLNEELISPEGFLQTFPHIHGTDGFFGARLRRL